MNSLLSTNHIRYQIDDLIWWGNPYVANVIESTRVISPQIYCSSVMSNERWWNGANNPSANCCWHCSGVTFNVICLINGTGANHLLLAAIMTETSNHTSCILDILTSRARLIFPALLLPSVLVIVMVCEDDECIVPAMNNFSSMITSTNARGSSDL
jgi:hypothetical protein